jgi:hypothetical protein
MQADSESDFQTANACADIYNWQMREAFPEMEIGTSSNAKATICPFEYNPWAALARGTKDESVLYLDRKNRGALTGFWLGYRTNKGKKVEYILRTVIIAGTAADVGVALRNTVIRRNASGKEIREDVDYQKRGEPVVPKPLPTQILKNLKVDEKEEISYKAIGCPREFLERSRKMLMVASYRHQSGAKEYLEQYKEIFDKWIEEIFEYYHSKKGCEKLNILTMTTLDYSTVKKVLLDYNIFKDLGAACKRPEGPYSKVKESDYFVTKFLTWRLSQGLYEINRRVNWKVDVENKLLLHLTIMQIFCVLCEQGRYVHKHLVVVQKLRASTNKLEFINSLNPVQKSMLQAFNVVTLHMYRKPHIGIVDRMDDLDIGEDVKPVGKEELEEEKKGEATGGVQEEVESEKRKEEENVIMLRRKDGFYEYKDGEEVLKDIYERTEETVKEKECSDFKKHYKRVTEEEEREFEEVINRFRPLGPSNAMDSVFSENRVEDFTEGLKSVLSHYLNPPRNSK